MSSGHSDRFSVSGNPIVWTTVWPFDWTTVKISNKLSRSFWRTVPLLTPVESFFFYIYCQENLTLRSNIIYWTPSRISSLLKETYYSLSSPPSAPQWPLELLKTDSILLVSDSDVERFFIVCVYNRPFPLQTNENTKRTQLDTVIHCRNKNGGR